MPAVSNAGFFDWFRIDFANQSAQARSSVEAKTNVYERGDRDEEIAYLQQKLTNAGFYDGKISGLIGAKTQEAVRVWQMKNGLKTTGVLDEQTILSIAGISDREDSVKSSTRGGSPNLNIKVFLGGSYNSDTGLMSTALNDLNLIPLTEPYSVLGYDVDNDDAEIINSSVLDVEGSNAIVDWVVLETRSNGDPMEILFSEAALLQADGDVVSVDGISPLTYSLINGPSYFMIKHRNHLPIMNAEEILIDGETDINFTNISLFGQNPAKVVNGVQVMWPGDINENLEVKYTGEDNDRDVILLSVGATTPNSVLGNTYSLIDVNMDGQIKYTGADNDRDIILQTVGGITPNNVVQAQLPELSDILATFVSSEYSIASEPGQSDVATFEIKFEVTNMSESDIQIPESSELTNDVHTAGEGLEFGFSGTQEQAFVGSSILLCDNCSEIPGGYNLEEGETVELTLHVVGQPQIDGYFSMYLNSINWSNSNNVLGAENFYDINLGQTSSFVTNYAFLNAN